MIAGRIGDHAARQIVFGNRQDEVGRASDLERAAALEVFALEEDAGAGQSVEGARSEDWRAANDAARAFGGGLNVGELNFRH